jgi:FkbM family methyltransferase
MEKSIKIGIATYSVTSDDQYLASVGDEFEPAMAKLYAQLIPSNVVVADIGANIGLTSLLFSQRASRVYAFEPSPTTSRILMHNLSKNHVTNVVPVNLGLGECERSSSLIYATNNRSGAHVSQHTDNLTNHINETVQITTLDRFCASEQIDPAFLKMDVEGFERNVILGGEKLLARRKPTVVLECNHFCLNVLQNITLPDFFSFLRERFPVLMAVDADTGSFADIHDKNISRSVMYEHVVNNKFCNIVAGFKHEIKEQVYQLRVP